MHVVSSPHSPQFLNYLKETWGEAVPSRSAKLNDTWISPLHEQVQTFIDRVKHPQSGRCGVGWLDSSTEQNLGSREQKSRYVTDAHNRLRQIVFAS